MRSLRKCEGGLVMRARLQKILGFRVRAEKRNPGRCNQGALTPSKEGRKRQPGQRRKDPAPAKHASQPSRCPHRRPHHRHPIPGLRY